MDWTAHLDTAAAAAALCSLGGLVVPWLIAAVPEPAPDDRPDDRPEPAGDAEQRAAEEPKELYADIARSPGLAWRAAGWAAACGGLVGLAIGWDWSLAFLLPVVPVLVALSVIDFHTRLLPTRLVQPAYLLVAAGLAVAWIATRDTPDLLRALVGALIAFVVFFLMWFINPRGMGYGDVRLSGVLGLALGHLGWGQLFVGLYAGFLIFGLPGLTLALLRRDRALLKTAYPFGPFMVLGALLGVLWGGPLWSRFTGG